jgi:hypothetical protein
MYSPCPALMPENRPVSTINNLVLKRVAAWVIILRPVDFDNFFNTIVKDESV